MTHGLIDSIENGATEVFGTSNNSLFVFLGGPIRNWWKPGMWGSREHKLYTTKRDYVRTELSADFMVYAPHLALRGPWDERGQLLNDFAVTQCDAFVWLRMDGVTATGTELEQALAVSLRIPTFMIQVGDKYDTAAETQMVKEQLHVLNIQRKGN